MGIAKSVPLQIGEVEPQEPSSNEEKNSNPKAETALSEVIVYTSCATYILYVPKHSLCDDQQCKIG